VRIIFSGNTHIAGDSIGVLIGGYLGLLWYGVPGLFFGVGFGYCVYGLFLLLLAPAATLSTPETSNVSAGNIHSKFGAASPEYTDVSYDTRKIQFAAHSLARAYQCLGIRRTASDEEVKHKYRALMSAHHPDKFSSTGSVSASIERATEKVQEISRAYERIKKSRSGLTYQQKRPV
jgi:hypothetical protein